VIGLGLPEATASLQKAGLVPGRVHYRFDIGPAGLVSRQGLPPEALATKGSAVNLEVGTLRTKPAIVAPAAGSNVTPNSMPLVKWTAANPAVSRWLVVVQPERCTKTTVGTETCSGGPTLPSQVVTATEHRSPQPTLTYVDTAKAGWRHNGFLTIYVYPIDDVGNLGEFASVRVYLEH
jgi:hypothetical protein